LKKILKTRIEENQAVIEKTNRDLEEWQEKYYVQLFSKSLGKAKPFRRKFKIAEEH
jgi:hypothetical protein